MYYGKDLIFIFGLFRVHHTLSNTILPSHTSPHKHNNNIIIITIHHNHHLQQQQHHHHQHQLQKQSTCLGNRALFRHHFNPVCRRSPILQEPLLGRCGKLSSWFWGFSS